MIGARTAVATPAAKPAARSALALKRPSSAETDSPSLGGVLQALEEEPLESGAVQVMLSRSSGAGDRAPPSMLEALAMRSA